MGIRLIASDANNRILIGCGMDPTLLFLSAAGVTVLFMIFFWIYGTYNRMVDLEEETKNQWQNLEAQIAVKSQKIALVEDTDLVQVGLESNVYEMIVEARKLFADSSKSGNRSGMAQASGMMDSIMPKALAFAEDNPQLTSYHVLVEGLQQGIYAISKMASEVEEYNQSAKNYNTYIRMFPAVLVAKMMGFNKADYFDELSEEEVSSMFRREAELGAFVESAKSEDDIRAEETQDEVKAIEAEIELLEAKARLKEMKESLEE